MPVEQIWHAPEQADEQHTFETQKPEAHCVPPVQAEPLASCGVQVDELQKLPGAQSLSKLQRLGQLACVPEQTYGAHAGLEPGPPFDASVHWPGVTLQTSQPPEQAVWQQTPSVQKPELH